ncbi:putative transcription factor bZIP family [Helianthus annuus]|uniref:Putative basic-leucine zipper domain-containing protein n=1 Tax=Helianthus annuus TaxID=4232 RepID=A0A251T0J2_HELAN|nr:basic leucine zipper 43 [Helianthus annuus]KAF5777450.1 putative transcription factor bZIP family [Helianthus annuus]KAJ0492647.1 putative transcription factor bZIP family [Helianthus annuus]KAJ0504856.1 putative transcription factor bZIP family [Helianthus annuus]KAJ0862258.1 putative transcription factor bZIP family [Helianthus annuus]
MEENYNLIPKYEDFSSKFPPNFSSYESNISSIIELNSNIMYGHHQPRIPAVVNFSPSFSCNNSSSSNETDEGHVIINERKHRRMISNRESARRSRVRKQRQLDELCAQVSWLRSENHGLMVKLNRFLEAHEKVVQENDKLKKESLELKKLVSEAQLDNTYTNLGDLGFLRDLHDDVDHDHDQDQDDGLLTTCTTAHLRVQSSCRSNVASTTFDSSTLF